MGLAFVEFMPEQSGWGVDQAQLMVAGAVHKNNTEPPSTIGPTRVVSEDGV